MESSTFTPAQLSGTSLANIMAKRQLITQTGVRYALKVTGATPYVNKAGTPVMIINFAAMTQYHMDAAKTLIAQGELNKAGNQVVTASPRIGKDYIPTKGEIVDVVFDEVTTASGVTGLFPVSITPLAQATKGFVTLSEEDLKALEEAGA